MSRFCWGLGVIRRTEGLELRDVVLWIGCMKDRTIGGCGEGFGILGVLEGVLGWARGEDGGVRSVGFRGVYWSEYI